MKVKYLIPLVYLLPLCALAESNVPSSALEFQQTTNTRIVVEDNFLRFFTGNAERMTIDGSGNVGIGISNPGHKFEVEDHINNSAQNLYYDRQGVKIANHNSNLGSYTVLKLQTRSDPDGAYIRAVNRGNNNVEIGIGRYMSASGGVSQERITVLGNGNVGIGTTSPSYKLHVSGQVKGTAFISSTTTYADFVFDDGYELPALAEVEKFIEKNNHLPEIPSEEEARANGVNLQEMQAKLLQKIEELTLYVIALKKENEDQQRRIRQLESK